MKRVALIGFPVGHSLSPRMHQAAFNAVGLDWRYEAIATPPRDLETTVARLRDGRWAGANVTLPHKARLLSLLDEIAPEARWIGAANTIVNANGSLHGENTDVPGFLYDLDANGLDLENGPALVLGSGGAARSVVYGLAHRGVETRIICRRVEVGQRIAIDLKPHVTAEVTAHPWSPGSFRAASRGCRLVVNATPIGMAPHPEGSPWPAEVPYPRGAVAYDLVYNPLTTRFLAEASRAGLGIARGVGMFVEQGALAFERWTGLRAPRMVMRSAVEDALGGASCCDS